MPPESQNEAVRSADVDGALAGAPEAANDPQAARLQEQRWLRLETAGRIERALGELGGLARAAELRHLFYLLDMARLEAGAQTQRWQHNG